jgi:hypothetical protein
MRNLICLLFVVLSISCNKPASRDNEITRLELATSSCFGPCPVTAVSIDSSLNLRFYGGSDAMRKGYFTGKISQKIWDSINIKLESIDYKNLNIKFNDSADDQTLEVIAHYKNGKVKHVLATSFGLAFAKLNRIAKIFYWISNIYKSANLEPAKSPIKFETNCQYGHQSNVSLSFDSLNFRPLSKK